MGNIDYKKIYEINRDEWKALTREPQKYEALLAGHYSDSNHFVYELLQNAEDERATKVVFEYYKDRLVFYHNGDAFNEEDVKGVSSMLMGTKDKNSAQTIGRFGMGFKSVFKYTYQPEIYSDNEAFRIENYLLPVELDGKWDLNDEKAKLAYHLSSGNEYRPFEKEEHLTKIVIPFAKKNHEGDIVTVNGEDVLKKLKDLECEILLFLSNIKRLYWFDKTTDKYAMISLDESRKDYNIKTCRIEGTEYGDKEEISKYLKFTKKFDHSEMSSAEVSIAYKLNNRSNNVNEMKNTNVWVYFPTKDNTNLPFLVHGSFETAVSREKLMEPSVFNNYLYEQLEELICESLLELREKGLITQMFLRKVLLVAFKESRLPNLKQKVTDIFLANNLLPDKSGECRRTNEVSIAVPFGIAEFKEKETFADSFRTVKAFVAFNNEKESNFTEYFNWLRDDLHINIFNLESWANRLCKYENRSINSYEKGFDELKNFYEFLSDYRETVYMSRSTGYYSRGGPYESSIRECLSSAWKLLKQAPIILNAEQSMVQAYKGTKPNIYLNSSSQYKNVLTTAIVNSDISKEFKPLLEDGFSIKEFNNFQYVKEKVVNKYINIDEDINFENSEDYDEEYIEDINQIIKLIDDTHEIQAIQEMLKNAYIIQIKDEEGNVLFSRPQDVYTSMSEEGVNLEVYYRGIKSNKYCIHKEFYLNNGISINKLQQFGLYYSIVNEGDRRFDSRGGTPSWRALGEYCPKIEIDCLSENIQYIEENAHKELAKEKSAEILNIILKISKKLLGMIRYGKSYSNDEEEESKLLKKIIQSGEWLFDKNEKLCSIIGISKYDLNKEIYGEVINDKEAYKILGFIETEKDSKAETFDMVDSLDKRDKSILLRQLARELGMRIDENTSIDDEEFDEEDSTFDTTEWVSKEFPEKVIKNKESLIEHVRQQFFCADPTKYEKVLRQIRVSKNPKVVKAYTTGMYTNDSNVKICQICREPIEFVEVTEISNYGIEMNQLNLCLCKNCASKYKMFRDNNKDSFKNEMKKAICNLDIDNNYGECEIELNSDTSIYFTQTHVGEIQEIFKLIDEYGTPEEGEYGRSVNDTLSSQESAASSENYLDINNSENNSVEVRNGSFVEYKMLGTGELKEITINTSAFPLHNVFLGKHEGDRIDLSGKQYEIISIL